MISPMSAFRGTRSSVGTGAGRAGDKVKRSSRLRDLVVDLDATEREYHDVIDCNITELGCLTLFIFFR